VAGLASEFAGKGGTCDGRKGDWGEKENFDIAESICDSTLVCSFFLSGINNFLTYVNFS
jgi:hypothetical protein